MPARPRDGENGVNTCSHGPCRSARQRAPEQVEAQLLSSQAVVQPGQHFAIALRQRIAPHLHTYWLNPGDSGQATSIEWTLPAGARAGAHSAGGYRTPSGSLVEGCSYVLGTAITRGTEGRRGGSGGRRHSPSRTEWPQIGADVR